MTRLKLSCRIVQEEFDMSKTFYCCETYLHVVELIVTANPVHLSSSAPVQHFCWLPGNLTMTTRLCEDKYRVHTFRSVTNERRRSESSETLKVTLKVTFGQNRPRNTSRAQKPSSEPLEPSAAPLRG